MESLKDRVFAYEAVSDFKLTGKLPIVISLNGRSFRKTTSLSIKPYDPLFAKTMGQTLIKLASDIEGSVFLYAFNDEIVIVCRNDRQVGCWYDNYIQPIISASASIASISFLTAAQNNGLKLLGDPVFLGKVFIIPSFTEVVNYLIAKQNIASNTAISMACFYELLKKYDPDKVSEILQNLTIDEKYTLLQNECNVKINNYPLSFWRGFACYRVPKRIKSEYGDEVRYKLIIDDELPFFSKEQDFLANIIKR